MTAYFGCWKEPGHYLWVPPGRRASRLEERDYLAPKELDCNLIFLPPEVVGCGALTLLPGCRKTVLAWWGSPYDRRGKVNSAIIVRGIIANPVTVWQSFRTLFPELKEVTPPTWVETHQVAGNFFVGVGRV